MPKLSMPSMPGNSRRAAETAPADAENANVVDVDATTDAPVQQDPPSKKTPRSKPTATAKRGRPKSEALALASRNTPTPVAQISGIEGDVGADDVQVPGLSLVQPDSKLDQEFQCRGQFVFAKEASLGPEIKVIVARAEKRYQEDLPYDPNNQPKVFRTPAEAREAGVYQLNNLAILDLIIAVDVSGEDADLGVTSDDKYAYIPCRWWVTGRNYTSIFKALTTALILKKDSASYGRFFVITSKLAPARGRTLYQAFLKATDETISDDQLAIFRTIGVGSE